MPRLLWKQKLSYQQDLDEGRRCLSTLHYLFWMPILRDNYRDENGQGKVTRTAKRAGNNIADNEIEAINHLIE